MAQRQLLYLTDQEDFSLDFGTANYLEALSSINSYFNQTDTLRVKSFHDC